jgi:hypothetical protein
MRSSWGLGVGRVWLAPEIVMRQAGNFNLEWGYLAPAPNFMRTLRILVVSAAVGATGSAAVVFSLIDRPAAEESVAARTMAADAPSASVAALTPVLPPVAAQATHPLASDLGAVTTTARPASGAALAESPAIHDVPQNSLTPQRRLVQQQPVWQPPLSARTNRGPLALLRSFGTPTNAGPPRGDY